MGAIFHRTHIQCYAKNSAGRRALYFVSLLRDRIYGSSFEIESIS